MIKKLFFIPVAVLALASCSNNEPVIEREPVASDEAGNCYISFGIRGAEGVISRAEGD